MIDYDTLTFHEVLASRGSGKNDIASITNLKLAYKKAIDRTISAPVLSELCGIALYGDVVSKPVDIRDKQTFLLGVRTNHCSNDIVQYRWRSKTANMSVRVFVSQQEWILRLASNYSIQWWLYSVDQIRKTTTWGIVFGSIPRLHPIWYKINVRFKGIFDKIKLLALYSWTLGGDKYLRFGGHNDAIKYHHVHYRRWSHKNWSYLT